MTTADLFTAETALAPAIAPDSGLLVTNHLNLMYMLAAGLVMPPAGFGDKYYRDTLECFPGWIPLFIGKAPKEALESSTREAGHLKPVLVELGLSRMSGQVVVVAEDGAEERRFPDQLDGSERVILVPAPLPSSWIESVVFQSVADRQACERDAKDFGNVPLEPFKRKTNKTLFAKAPETPWPPGGGPAARTVPLERSLAAGGVMAMLFLFGNLGERAVHACRSAFDPPDDPVPPLADYPILAGLGTWVRNRSAPPPVPTVPEADRITLHRAFQAAIFWEGVERLVRWREAGRPGSAESLLLNHLAEASESLDPRVQAGIRKLHSTLESLTGLGDATASELFDRHDTPLGRAMTLFFLRRDCADLFDLRSERLGEPDWLAAAILFGARDGWLSVPLRLRAHPGLGDAVSHRMARMSHRVAGTGLELGEAPARVRPLRERFGDGSAWSRPEESAALELARRLKWDCVRTRISLGQGEYTLSIRGGALHIDVPGEPTYASEIDRERFFAHLEGARLDSKTEARVRGKLGG